MKTFVKKKTYEGLTAEEIKRYMEEEKTAAEVYGKYGNLALKYMKEHNKAKYWSLAGDLPEYLHNIDKEADRLYEVMYEKLSAQERYKHTGNFLENARKENEMQSIIEEEILSSIVYVD